MDYRSYTQLAGGLRGAAEQSYSDRPLCLPLRWTGNRPVVSRSVYYSLRCRLRMLLFGIGITTEKHTWR